MRMAEAWEKADWGSGRLMWRRAPAVLAGRIKERSPVASIALRRVSNKRVKKLRFHGKLGVSYEAPASPRFSPKRKRARPVRSA